MLFEQELVEVPVFSDELESFENALSILFRENPIMPLSTALALIMLARRLPALADGSMNLADVARDMKVNYATFMRLTDSLSQGGGNTIPMHLFEKSMHSRDRRARQLRLTEKGESLLREVEQALSSPCPSVEISHP